MRAPCILSGIFIAQIHIGRPYTVGAEIVTLGVVLWGLVNRGEVGQTFQKD